MENHIVEIKLTLEIPAANPGMAAKEVADTLRTALIKNATFSFRGLTMQAAAWEAPVQLTKRVR